MEYPKLYLKVKREQSVLRGHPWVFSGAIDRGEGRLIEGDIAELYSANDEFLGLGHLAGGSISLRVFSFDKVEANAEFWKSKIKKAYDLREQLQLSGKKGNSIYRLIHGEGDGLPGLIVDVYGQTAVIQAHSLGMHLIRETLAEAIVAVTGNSITRVYNKSQESLEKHQHEAEPNSYLIGEGETWSVEEENGLKFKIDWENGQKTGFFIDQRENRELLRNYSKGKSVLNTFCYTGGFSVYALAGGASRVDSLDSSSLALDLTEENIALNGFKNHSTIKADAVQYLKDLDQKYDIIVLDPPAFAKHQKARHSAVQAYKRINAHALRQMPSGSLLFTFSCSQAVDKELFTSTVRAAAIEANRSVRIIHQLHQPKDHPINIAHPEGEYLKGLVLYVD
jgi:23S rRNA (cytosine1962-C5)-methyltransferase